MYLREREREERNTRRQVKRKKIKQSTVISGKEREKAIEACVLSVHLSFDFRSVGDKREAPGSDQLFRVESFSLFFSASSCMCHTSNSQTVVESE